MLVVKGSHYINFIKHGWLEILVKGGKESIKRNTGRAIGGNLMSYIIKLIEFDL